MRITADNWCQGAYARDANGNALNDITSPDACKWCAYGHLMVAFKNHADYMPAVRRVEDELGVNYLTNWNDLPGRKAEDVQAAFDKAGIVLPG